VSVVPAFVVGAALGGFAAFALILAVCGGVIRVVATEDDPDFTDDPNATPYTH